MSKIKQAKLLEQLGENMAESAGAIPVTNDRYEGFVAAKSTSGEMALDRIMEDPDQPRKSFDEDALQFLAESIKNDGVRSPIELRWSEKPGKWLIVFGHRRYRAAKMAGLKTIPCMFRDDHDDESTIRVRQLVENCQREDLAPMEMARAIKALAELTGWSNRKIAGKLSISRTSIGRYFDLLGLSEEVQQEVNEGKLALSVATEMRHIEDRTQQRNVANEIIRKNLPRQEAMQVIEQAAAPSSIAFLKSRKVKDKELLTQNQYVAVWRNPDVNDARIQKELLAIAALLDPEKAES